MAINFDYVADTFRRWGHLEAQIDPLGRMEPFRNEELEMVKADPSAKKWAEIYCGNIGAEFMHTPYTERSRWIAEQLEAPAPKLDQRFIFQRIVASLALERFLHNRYVGTIRFSSEGLSAMLPMLDHILIRAAELGFERVMIAMSHRARLTTIVHIIGVPEQMVFADFDDIDPKSFLGGGDVKYHRGATGKYLTPSGQSIMAHLASNPSHLESINPVLMGRVRARQEREKDVDQKKVLAVVFHGDAAFAGQGIAAETLNYESIAGFSVGGTIHIVLNNLIGFTALPHMLQSSRYCTDIVKRNDTPVFHVNAESPDDAVRVGLLAMDYRAKFRRDVCIDLVGYRLYGHNETDDPTVTQPTIYQKVKEVPSLQYSYGKKIGLTEAEVQAADKSRDEHLKAAQEAGKTLTKKPIMFALPEYWAPYTGGLYNPSMEVDTHVSAERIALAGERLSVFPKDFTIHPKLAKLVEQRHEMALGKRPIDWGGAENLAFATLLLEGYPIRLDGQDAGRGTFAHRHAVFHDHNNANRYIPLQHLAPDQAPFNVFDSMLSEAAALGFEYGYTRDYPEALVCWEAQFGDFANGAQIIIDQYLAAGEDKWNLLSGLVMLLPHGYEGRGPEHSSARIERFLQLAGEDNFQVCQPSSAGQLFHLLRRQMLRAWRKPLIVFTPKSLLRAPSASCDLETLTTGMFHPIVGDKPEFDGASRILIGAGKMVHELRAEREKKGYDDAAILALDQMYPFPEKQVSDMLARYTNAKHIIWVQEEPANMGALTFVRPLLEKIVGQRGVSTVRRSASASPATGSGKAHAMEQQAIIERAFLKYFD